MAGSLGNLVYGDLSVVYFPLNKHPRETGGEEVWVFLA
jgi:hypothetical protein